MAKATPMTDAAGGGFRLKRQASKKRMLFAPERAAVRDLLTASVQQDDDGIIVGQAPDASRTLFPAKDLKTDVVIVDCYLACVEGDLLRYRWHRRGLAPCADDVPRPGGNRCGRSRCGGCRGWSGEQAAGLIEPASQARSQRQGHRSGDSIQNPELGRRQVLTLVHLCGILYFVNHIGHEYVRGR